jgi:ankyrin repeat protein
MRGHIEIVKYLVENGADIYNDNKAFHLASFNGHFEIVKFFVEKGADINKKDNYDINPFVYAFLGGHYDIFKYLAKNGADIHVNDDHVLRLAKRDNKEEIVNFLIEFDKK